MKNEQNIESEKQNIVDTEKTTVVFFHKDCADGVTGAAVCLSVFGDAAEYIPITYGDIPNYSELCLNKYVIFVDFCPETSVQLLTICAVADRVAIFDHHETAINRFKVWEEFPELAEHQIAGKLLTFFNKTMSGAKLAAKYLLQQIPPIVELISDADLFTFNEAGSRNTSIAVRYICGNDPMLVLPMLTKKSSELNYMYFAGFGIASAFKEQERIIEENAIEISLQETKGWIVNATNNIHKTVLGNILAKRNDTFGIVYDITEREGKLLAKCSIRGQKPYENEIGKSEGFSVLKIAENFGGGGHEYAASFNLNLTDLEKLLCSELLE